MMGGEVCEICSELTITRVCFHLSTCQLSYASYHYSFFCIIFHEASLVLKEPRCFYLVTEREQKQRTTVMTSRSFRYVRSVVRISLAMK